MSDHIQEIREKAELFLGFRNGNIAYEIGHALSGDLVEYIEYLEGQIIKLHEKTRVMKNCGNCGLNIDIPRDNPILDFTTCEDCILNEDPDCPGLNNNWRPVE